MAKIDEKVADLVGQVRDVQNTLAWHFSIGGGGLAILFGALIAGVVWWLPGQMKETREQAKIDTQLALSPLQADLAVIKNQLATLVADQATTGGDAPIKVVTTMRQSLEATKDPGEVAFNTVSLVAAKAIERRVVADAGEVGKLGNRVLDSKVSVSNRSTAWSTAMQLVAYRSFLNEASVLRRPVGELIPEAQVKEWESLIPFAIVTRPEDVGKPINADAWKLYGRVKGSPALILPLARSDDPVEGPAGAVNDIETPRAKKLESRRGRSSGRSMGR